MKPLSRLLACAAPLLVIATPAVAQYRSMHPYQWYWGVQVGLVGYKTNTQPLYFDPEAGAHWLITGQRTALYMGFEQAHFLTAATATVVDPNSQTGLRDVSFVDVRRLLAGVLAFPKPGHIEPYFGGGFAIVQVLNPLVDCSGTTPNSQCSTIADQTAAQDQASNAASKAFFWLMAGFQINIGKLGVFGQYMATSSAHEFLIDGPTHNLQGGIRYSFGTAKEGITERH